MSFVSELIISALHFVFVMQKRDQYPYLFDQSNLNVARKLPLKLPVSTQKIEILELSFIFAHLLSEWDEVKFDPSVSGEGKLKH